MQTRPRPVKYRAKNKLRKTYIPGEPGIELRPHQVLIRPLVTEKTNYQSVKFNAYSFLVAPIATKTDIKNAVESLFKVRVTGISTQIRHGKKRRFKQVLGNEADWKKATVTLHEEDKIEFV
jgi:large subunit ribosomal protein L23